MRILKIVSLVILLLSLNAASTIAQNRFSNDRKGVYVSARTGVTHYSGDLSRVNGQKQGIGFPAAGGEIMYAFHPRFSAVMRVQTGDFPRVGNPAFMYAWMPGDYGYELKEIPVYATTWRLTAQLLMQYAFLKVRRFAFYTRLGVHATPGMRISGWSGVTQAALGPAAGIGSSYNLNNRFALFTDVNLAATFPDRAIDGFVEGPKADSSPFDLLAVVGVGVRMRLTSSFASIKEPLIRSPSQLNIDERGVFTADLSNTPSKPLRYYWEFGDGRGAVGRTVAHSYNQPGIYTVELTVSNEHSSKHVSAELLVNKAEAEHPPVSLATYNAEAEPTARSNKKAQQVAACQEALEISERRYYRSELSKAIEALRPCTSNEISAEQKVQTYRLVSFVQISEGTLDEAKNTVLKLLGVEPTYTPDPVHDPPNYVALVTIVRHQLGLQ